MRKREQIYRYLAKLYFDQQARWVSTVTPDIYEKKQEHLILKAFEKACRVSPAYRVLLREHGVNASRIRSFSDFRREVPIIDKTSFFNRFPLEKIYPEMTSNSRGRIWTSSGTSRTFSIGYESPHAAANSTALDFMLHFFFRVIERKTLFINCLPDSWPVPSRFVHYANVGTREDATVSLIKRLNGTYDQFILGGEPLLLKHIIEHAVDEGVDFSRTHVQCIAGGDYVPLSFKQYMSPLLNPSAETEVQRQNRIYNVMGMAEFGVGVFFETTRTAGIRSAVSTHKNVAQKIAPNRDTIPQIFQYNPFSTFVENLVNSDGDSTLVLTNLSKQSQLPLIRYHTGDTGRVFPFDTFCEEIKECSNVSRTVVEFPFPFVAAVGKKRSIHLGNGHSLDVSSCAERIFSFPNIASKVTGNFSLHPPTGRPKARLNIQLTKACGDNGVSEHDQTRFSTVFDTNRVDIAFIPFHEFHHHMGICFDRKLNVVRE